MKEKVALIIFLLMLLPVTFFGQSYVTGSSGENPLDEYTWATMMYNHPLEYEEFGMSDVPKPDQGTVLIPSNMMSLDVCRTAVALYREKKAEILQLLDKYIVEHMIHDNPAFIPMKDEWDPPGINTWRKTNTDEMKARGNLCIRGEYVGDCLSLSCFTTSVLRLCGFSPEEVFNIILIGHVVNVVQIDGKWYAVDSSNSLNVRRGQIDSLIYEFYPPYYNGIMGIENDKYFVSFGTLWPDIYPYLTTPFSNMNETLLCDIADDIVPLFNNSYLGGPKELGGYEWDIHDFIENATLCPDMATVAFPYTVANATGSTDEEKAQSLLALNKEFILNQTGGEQLNQYDRSLYATGFLSVEYPQAYANAAKYAAWTGLLAGKFDSASPVLDCMMTALRFRLFLRNHQILPTGCIDFPDLNLLCRTGSSLDKALLSYGTLRNMKKDTGLWQPKDLYIVVTDDYKGYLAVKTSDHLQYLNFEKGRLILPEISNGILFVFNEENKYDTLP